MVEIRITTLFVENRSRQLLVLQCFDRQGADLNSGGQTVTVTVTDRCVGCSKFDLDFSPAAFDVLADPSLGR